MSVLKCKMCGGTIEFEQGATVGTCEYCGTQQTLPKSSDEVVANLFNRANNLRLKCEFDKAAEIYEKIVEQDDSEAEAHWGIVLCKYGIEYVEDPKTMKRIPTCHRTLFEAVTADPDYLAAIDYSDAAQQTIYESEARAIDRIQKDILSIVKNEKPFDVFICYKESDSNGKRTVDSTIANDIYYQLTEEGFKVFYAAITLEDKIGQEYEPYIFAALNSAKVMLVIGTRPEYFTAVWVKNEWSRYLKLMKTDRSKLLIPCYRDMDAYDLPEEFAHLQAQDMSKIGFINDVVRGIKKVATTEKPREEVVRETVAAAVPQSNAVPLLKRGFMFLEDGEWQKAEDFFEQVLNLDPENAQAYLGKLMAELKVPTREKLKDCAEPFDQSNNFKKAMRFADPELKNTLNGYIVYINERNKTARLNELYDKAQKAMHTAKTESELKTAARFFDELHGFKNSAELSKQCLEMAETSRKNAIYTSAKASMAGEKIAAYESAISKFQTIPGWKDVDAQIDACQRKIDEIKAKEEAAALAAAQKAKERWIAAEKAKMKAKKILIIIAVCIVLAVLMIQVIIPSIKYKNAIALLYNGQIIDGYEQLIALDGFKDSKNIASDFEKQYITEKVNSLNVGDTIIFGKYEQDNKTTNGKEDIEWIILEKKDQNVLLLSKNVLDSLQYNNSRDLNTFWETSSLRTWLNISFLNSAFTSDEKKMIISTTVGADKNPNYNTYQGKTTVDKVFLLSIAEAKKYFSNGSSRQCSATEYAKSQGASTIPGDNSSWWWLRTAGEYLFNASYVYRDGVIDYVGSTVLNSGAGVRPAMWIDLGT